MTTCGRGAGFALTCVLLVSCGAGESRAPGGLTAASSHASGRTTLTLSAAPSTLVHDTTIPLLAPDLEIHDLTIGDVSDVAELRQQGARDGAR